MGVGYIHLEDIHLEDARARSIPVAAARNLIIGDHLARGPEFTKYDPNLLHGYDVFGGVLGIIGMGNIGKAVARRAKAFDMKVLYHNRKRNPQAETELGVTYATLPDLLQQADFVTLPVLVVFLSLMRLIRGRSLCCSSITVGQRRDIATHQFSHH